MAVAVQLEHDVLVLLADEHHLRQLDRGLVRDPQAGLEPPLHAEPLHVARDVGAAAVHDYRVHADVLEEDDVAREVLGQAGVGHRGAADLDHDGLAVELPDVGQRLEEGCDVSHVVYSALTVTYSCERSEKKTSVSPPSPGIVSSNSISLPVTASSSARTASMESGSPSPAVTTRRPSMSRSTTNGGGRTCPAAWRMRPKFGAAPWSAVFTSGEFATERATGSTWSTSPRTTIRPTRFAPSPSDTISIASWRIRASIASPNSSSSRDSGST